MKLFAKCSASVRLSDQVHVKVWNTIPKTQCPRLRIDTSVGPWFCHMKATKIQINLCISAV